MTREGDEHFQFRNSIEISNQNIQELFQEFEQGDFVLITNFIKLDDGMIQRRTGGASDEPAVISQGFNNNMN